MATIDLGKIKQVWRGTYNNSTAYTVDDLVAYTDTVNGNPKLSTYIAVANTTGNAPASNGSVHASWNLVADGAVSSIPSMSGNAGKFLKTNGSQLLFEETFVSGMILLWSGTIATIPTGWVLCDGNNSSPDLRDRFVVGAKQDDSGTPKTNVSGSLTQTGGAATDTVNISISGTTGTNNATGNALPNNAASYASSSHQHSFSGSDSDTVNTLPPYYALAYIMKT